jgi:hypothetical protein
VRADARVLAAAALAALDLPPARYDEEEELPPIDPRNEPQALACDLDWVDVIIYGGGAGGGKSWWGYRECLKGYTNPLHRAMMLRRTTRQAMKPGGMWTGSTEMFFEYGARSRSGELDHTMPSGATVTVGGCEHEKDMYNYDSSELTTIFFDQLEQFTAMIFWYIAITRARSVAGIKTKVRASANPIHERDKIGGWLATMLMDGGWVDRDTGGAVEDMSGVVKYFYRVVDTLKFYGSEEEAREDNPDMEDRPMSMTFIEARLDDNAILMEKDPDYRKNMNNLPLLERKRLLGCNWKVSASGGGYVRKEWFRRLPRDPSGGDPAFWSHRVRSWDLAATEGGKKDKTAGILSGRSEKTGRIVFSDPIWCREKPGHVTQLIIETALRDGSGVTIRIPIDPAQAGKSQPLWMTDAIRKRFAEEGLEPPPLVFEAERKSRVKGDTGKVDRGRDFMSAAEPPMTDSAGIVEIYGNIDFVDGEHTEMCLDELHHFDGKDGGEDDFWDVCVAGYNEHAKRLGAPEYAVY